MGRQERPLREAYLRINAGSFIRGSTLYVTYIHVTQDGSAEVLTSFESCASIVCSNGKPGYKLPGQCCESCSEFSISSEFVSLRSVRACTRYLFIFSRSDHHNYMYLLFTDFDIGFDTTSNMAIGTSEVAVPPILQPTWGEWGNWTECSRACGGGRQSRVRECLNEGRTSLNCTGNRVEVRTCNTQCCPGLWVHD